MGVVDQVEEMNDHIRDGRIKRAYGLFKGTGSIYPSLNGDELKGIYRDLATIHASRSAKYGTPGADVQAIDQSVAEVDKKKGMLDEMFPGVDINWLQLTRAAGTMTRRIRRDKAEYSENTVRLERKFAEGTD